METSAGNSAEPFDSNVPLETRLNDQNVRKTPSPRCGVRMKYFDEEKMAEIRKAFDSEVLKWKDVVSRPMMGCLCYFHKRRFVCVLVTDGIVVMKLSDKDQASLKDRFGGKPFEMAGKNR